MRTTSHAKRRMRQRGIPAHLVDLVLEEGIPLRGNPDRVLLTRRILRSLLEDGRIGRREFDRAERALPVICVVARDCFVSTWRPKPSINDVPQTRRTSGTRPGIEFESEDMGEAA